MAAIPASLTCAGVSKSGSPALSDITSAPCAPGGNPVHHTVGGRRPRRCQKAIEFVQAGCHQTCLHFNKPRRSSVVRPLPSASIIFASLSARALPSFSVASTLAAGMTTTPSSSATTRSPAVTGVPAKLNGKPTDGALSFNVPRTETPRANTGNAARSWPRYLAHHRRSPTPPRPPPLPQR